MLSIFKKKTVLKDFIPPGHVDIHSHLLPGIDDGAKTIGDTRMLIDGMKDIGFTEFITTPHIMSSVWENTPEGIREKESETLTQLIPGTSLKAAAEYMIDSNFPKLFQQQELLCLYDNYVLVEMSYTNPPINLQEILFDLQVAGYRPVLAHPERYAFYHRSFGEYEKLRHTGCLFQLNLLSTVGYYGPSVTEVAEKLLKVGLIDVAGSDVHHSKHLEAFGKKLLIRDTASLQKAIENTAMFRS